MDNIISAKNLNLYYGENHALKDIAIDIERNKITALIGPSGCGKSSFLKVLNRMQDFVDDVKITGEVLLDGENIYGDKVDVTLLRKKVGMVFQKPNPFPMSIYENVALGRGQGQIEEARAQPFGRPAAAALHCESACCRARGAADGRTDLRA